MNNKSISLITLAVILLSYFTACKKTDTPATGIVGTWLPSMQTAVETQNHVFLKDTSFVLTPAILGLSSLSFTVGGQYNFQPYPSGAVQTGNYTYSGGILNLTTGPQAGAVPVVINGNTFSFYTIDTMSMSPLTIDSVTMFFTRQ